MTSKRPFHETVVDVINRCPKDNLAILLELLVNTKVPSNKDAIVNALENKKGDQDKDNNALDYAIKCILD